MVVRANNVAHGMSMVRCRVLCSCLCYSPARFARSLAHGVGSARSRTAVYVCLCPCSVAWSQFTGALWWELRTVTSWSQPAVRSEMLCVCTVAISQGGSR